MHRATVFDALLLGETYSGRGHGIYRERYAEDQRSEQKKLHVYAFHI
jgi:hypothetical protein